MIATNLRMIRRQKKITQEELSKRTKLTTRCISLIENQKRMPYLDTAIKIAKALEVSMDELVLGGNYE